MFASQDLSISVCKGMFGNTEHFRIGDDVTILTKDNQVFKGIIECINKTNFNLAIKDNEEILIYYNDMSNIVDSEWLGDEDIRSS